MCHNPFLVYVVTSQQGEVGLHRFWLLVQCSPQCGCRFEDLNIVAKIGLFSTRQCRTQMKSKLFKDQHVLVNLFSVGFFLCRT